MTVTYFLQQLLNGLTTGAVYASLGLALVLIYRTTNIANFAQGEMATFSAFMSWQLHEWGLPVIWAILIVMVLSMVLGAVVYAVLVRPVQYKDEMTIIIVTLGLYLALFQKTRLGLALRAAASNAQSSQLVGIPYTRMMILGWGMAASLGAVSGVLVASRLSLDPNMMGDVIIYAFASAVVGGMSSYVGAVVGGAIVGISQAFSTAFLPSLGSDLQLVVPMVLICVVLIFKPEGLFGKTVAARV